MNCSREETPPAGGQYVLISCLYVSCGAWRRFYLHEFGGDQPEASMLKALDDLATQSSLDAIGLHGNEGTLHVCLGGCTGNRK